ncbi:MAG: hypothetical protein ACFFF9_15355 [Candidatus Thorarchaeota archaeon]
MKEKSRVCQIPPIHRSGFWRQNPRTTLMSISLMTILYISVLSSQMIFPFFFSGSYEFDVLLLDVDQDGNLVKNAIYETNLRSDSVPFWGKITELTDGGFAIAGYADTQYSVPYYHQLCVIRTDEDYNIVWNKTYGISFEVRAISEMNNGDLAIGHYIDDYANERSTFQILVIDGEGEYVREQSWSFSYGWLSGFSHCDDGGFILAKEIYHTPDSSPFWIARIDTDLSVVWNKTYPSFATHTDILEDMAGGFTMPLEPGLDGPIGIVRLDDQGNETSRVFTNSIETGQYLTLIQCSNGDYLAGGPRYIIRFNIEGDILWEKTIDFNVHGFQELSPDRFVVFSAVDVRNNRWGGSGMYLECFDAGGTTIWIRSIQADGFFVPDIISNADGGLSILGMVDPHYLSSVLYQFESETPEDFDIWLLDVDQDGNLVHNMTYDTNFRLSSVPFWGKITELTDGGFAIAGYHQIDIADSKYDDRELWVIRTDEEYNIVWNRTYGKTWEIRSIAERNNGDLAIGHYIDDYAFEREWSDRARFQILIIDDEGEQVRERTWHCGYLNGFSHYGDGEFILHKETSPYYSGWTYWIARIDADLSVVWNNTYPCEHPRYALSADITEDLAGGFTMPLEPGWEGPIGVARFDDQGGEFSRIYTTAEVEDFYGNLWITQCSNGDYFGWFDSYIIRFDNEGVILWEKNVSLYVHGIMELSPDRFVAFEAAGIRGMGGRNSGLHLECFDADGTSIWTRSVEAAGLFVPDIISNSNGYFTILGMLDPNYLPSVLDSFSIADTETSYTMASSQDIHSWLLSEIKFRRL